MLDLGLVAGALVTILWYERRRILSWPAWSRRAPTSNDAPLAQAEGAARAPAVDPWVSIAANFPAKRRRYARAFAASGRGGQ